MEPKIVLVNLGDGRKYNQIDESSGLASVGLQFIATYLRTYQCHVTVIDQSLLSLSMNDLVKEIVKIPRILLG